MALVTGAATKEALQTSSVCSTNRPRSTDCRWTSACRLACTRAAQAGSTAGTPALPPQQRPDVGPAGPPGRAAGDVTRAWGAFSEATFWAAAEARRPLVRKQQSRGRIGIRAQTRWVTCNMQCDGYYVVSTPLPVYKNRCVVSDPRGQLAGCHRNAGLRSRRAAAAAESTAAQAGYPLPPSIEQRSSACWQNPHRDLAAPGMGAGEWPGSRPRLGRCRAAARDAQADV
jgi:hypothetical protein